MAITNIIDTINTHARGYLDCFFVDNPISVQLVPFKETKKITKPCINMIIEYKGMECDLTMLSGGELSRVVLAYTLALSEMFNTPLLLLDECTSSLDQDLTNAGYSVDRISNYTSLPVEEIDKKTLNFLEKNPPDAIFIYSSRSAKNLFNLINKHSLLNVVTQSNLMCISEKVLLVLKQIKWKKVFVFNPGEEEFLLNKIK